MAQQMLSEQATGQGLGPAFDPRGPLFSHNGSNEGYRSGFFAYVDGGRGAFVMTNSDNGSPLATQILFAVAQEYGWPLPAPSEKVAVTLDSAALERWAGRYRMADAGIAVDVGVERDSLRVHLPDGTVFTLVPQSDSTFFSLVEGYDAVFGARGDSATVRMVGLTGVRERSGA